MQVNEAGWDRGVRIVLGLGLLALTAVGPRTAWGLVGIVPLLTGIVGFCPLYRVFGFSTCPVTPPGGGSNFRVLTVLAAAVSMGAVLGAQGRGTADMQVMHQLVDNRAKITRTVTPRPDGVESLTESDDPAIAKLIQTHVEAMGARVKERRPIHQRDPLFVEVFKYADRIAMQYEATPKGIRVIETSTDAYAVKLIQAHAEVVSLFLKNGRDEMMKNHAVPEKGK